MTPPAGYLPGMPRQSTPLPELDEAEASAFWQRYLAATGAKAGAGYQDLSCFGDSVELADELIELVLIGRKRATASSVDEFDHEGWPLPRAGERWSACDGAGTPRALIETTEVRIGPLSSVDDRFAWEEGEGDRTRGDWLRGHTEYFSRTHSALGIPFNEEIPVAFERFTVPFQE